MRDHDHRIFRTFEEFERDELRHLESMSASVDAMIDTLFGDEVDEGPVSRRSGWDDDDEE